MHKVEKFKADEIEEEEEFELVEQSIFDSHRIYAHNNLHFMFIVHLKKLVNILIKKALFVSCSLNPN